MSGSGVVAAVDCGTNSTRILVTGPDGVPLERLMHITRLGARVDRTGLLDPEAVARTLDVLADYRAVMDRHHVTAVRATATSAARDASNREVFFAAATATLGTVPELLTGDQEAELSYAGATAELDPADGPWLVVDVGGGSTELAVGPAAGAGGDLRRPRAVRSLDIGCVRLTERYLHHDPPRPDELAAARQLVDGLLVDALAEQPELGGGRRLVGLAGTVAALAAIDQGLDHYDHDRLHHHRLTRDRVAALLDELSRMTAAERARRPGVETERAGVLVGGTLAVLAVLDGLGFDEMLTSEADILDGLAATLRS